MYVQKRCLYCGAFVVVPVNTVPICGPYCETRLSIKRAALSAPTVMKWLEEQKKGKKDV